MLSEKARRRKQQEDNVVRKKAEKEKAKKTQFNNPKSDGEDEMSDQSSIINDDSGSIHESDSDVSLHDSDNDYIINDKDDFDSNNLFAEDSEPEAPSSLSSSDNAESEDEDAEFIKSM